MKFVAWMAYHLESREIVVEYVRLAGDALDGHELIICEDLGVDHARDRGRDVMIGWRILPELLARSKKLKWIQFGSTGMTTRHSPNCSQAM